MRAHLANLLATTAATIAGTFIPIYAFELGANDVGVGLLAAITALAIVVVLIRHIGAHWAFWPLFLQTLGADYFGPGRGRGAGVRGRRKQGEVLCLQSIVSRVMLKPIL
jgi:hypothetical protein